MRAAALALSLALAAPAAGAQQPLTREIGPWTIECGISGPRARCALALTFRDHMGRAVSLVWDDHTSAAPALLADAPYDARTGMFRLDTHPFVEASTACIGPRLCFMPRAASDALRAQITAPARRIWVRVRNEAGYPFDFEQDITDSGTAWTEWRRAAMKANGDPDPDATLAAEARLAARVDDELRKCGRRADTARACRRTVDLCKRPPTTAETLDACLEFARRHPTR